MFYILSDNHYILRVRLTPNSSSCKILGTTKDVNDDTFLKISVISVPEKGKANKELVSFLSKKLKIAKSEIEIISGELDKWKKIKLNTDKISEQDLLNLAENI